ncbi:MAG: PEGA domain-containing protein [Firmicutes bacterium]|nr:PEGA domain-containing protein [Candidatus Fermentithermobacillaceae bacterium]
MEKSVNEGGRRAERPSGVRGPGQSRRTFGKTLVRLGAIAAVGSLLFVAGMKLALALNTVESEAVLYAVRSDKLLVFEPGITPEAGEAYHALPLSSGITVLDSRGRAVDPASLGTGLTPGTVLEVSRRKDGQVLRVQVVPDGVSLEGEFQGMSGGKITVSGQEFSVDASTVFAYEGSKLGSSPFSSLEKGDVVRVSSRRGRALAVELISPSGLVRVSSGVDGARVYVDGKYRGKTPLEIKIAAGEHEIRVKVPGRSDAVAAVLVEPRKEVAVALDPKAPAGVVTISSQPPDADVSVDGTPRGKTPLSVTVSPGFHDVVVSKEGFLEQQKRVFVEDGARETLEFTLEVDPEAPPKRVLATVVQAWPDAPALEVRYENGRRARLDVRNVPLYQGVFTTSWDRVLPGEELELQYDPAGKLTKAVRVTVNRFRLEGQVMWISGDVIVVSERFYRCRLNPDALVFRNGTEVSPDAILPGDKVIVQGGSAEDIRYVSAQDVLGERYPLEVFLVKTRDGFTIYSDDVELPWFSLGPDLKAVEEDGRALIPLSSVPSGSRLRLYFDLAGKIVWANLIFKAALSEEGKIAALDGSRVFLNSSWRPYSITEETAVYRDGVRRSFFDLSIGDAVLVAANKEGQLKFVHVRNRIRAHRITSVVLSWQASKAGRLGWEIPERAAEEPAPILVNFRDPVPYPSQLANIPFQKLAAGDRLKLWLDKEDNVLWAEVLSLNEMKVDGYYMGQKNGKLYFSGFAEGALSPGAVFVGFSTLDQLGPGSRVVAGGRRGLIDYIEAISLAEGRRWYSGTVLSVSGGLLKLFMDEHWVLAVPVTRDSRFVDWNLRVDDRVDKLFTGEQVRVFVDSDMDYVWGERTSTPQLKVEGVVEQAQGRHILVNSKSYVLSADAVVYKNGELTTAWALAKGDKIRAAGPNRENIEIVVVGW